MHTQELKKKLTRVSRELHPNGSNSLACADEAKEAVLSFLAGKVDHDTLTLARSLMAMMPWAAVRGEDASPCVNTLPKR